ncbi:hypothetical protein ACJMK2_027169 [Sinanodonta woodiana]|uniref:Protein zer-1 homolog-like C-terminal domain-containing protein n=1 Tax=Sinanodonta woodiana TaxID=1069815 RepID=A0ABD3XLU8_SINWO
MAAGIVANLAINEEDKRLVEEMEPCMLDNLKEMILSWEQPEEQIFECGSLKLFVPLLHCSDTPALQLWALWSLQHICIHSGELRCQKLEDYGVSTLLINLAEDSEIDHDVVKFIKDILQLTEQTMQ